MPQLAGLPYFEVEFTKDGAVFAENEAQALLAPPATDPPTDLLVISHGWNNDMAEARALYSKFFDSVAAVLPAVGGLPGRRFAVLGVLWPSKKFAEEDLIPSGAAGVGDAVTDDSLAAQIDVLKTFIDNPEAARSLDGAKSLLGDLEDDPVAQDAFARIVRAHLPMSSTEEDWIPDDFLTIPGDDLLRRLGRPMRFPRPAAAGTGGAAVVGAGGGSTTGGAAGIGQLFSGIKAGARNLLNFVTYYRMKDRAGVVGRLGLSPLLRRIRAARPELKIHLIGHSFGGRLVTAAATALGGQPEVRLATLTLLQAAFSHYGFALHYDGSKDGLFRKLVTERRVSGPILITCTANDRAVGLAYPIASRIARQIAAAIGDKDDPYGGLGRNGAQKTPEARDGQLLPLGATYQLQAGTLHNLNADAYITDHSDIARREVAYAMLSAVAAT